MLNYKLPRHVVIVMDGNGRWAESRGLPRMEGHRVGAQSVKRVVSYCLQKNIGCLSLFAFSSENWSRPAAEVDFLMALFLESLKREMEELNQQGVQMRFTGDRTLLESSLQAQMKASEVLTQHNTRLILNIVVNYGGKWDIVTAAKKLITAVEKGEMTVDEVNESSLGRCLDTYGLPEPDLFIRTSGELRISNFFLWQLAYTELYFTEVYWPDFDECQFELALDAYARRNRRFGLTN